MNFSGKFIACLLGGLALTAGVRADDVLSPGDPYATVIARNIFGLNPPQLKDPNSQNTDPPPKITPNGIMTIFGELQVLFKVAGAPKPGGPPPTDESYILSEGQRQDDIEVVKIDEKNSIVTFNNHGETQQLPLVVTQPSSTPSPATAGPTGGAGTPGGRFNPGLVNPGGGPGARVRGGGGAYGGSGVNSSGNGANSGVSGGAGNNANVGSNFGNTPARNNTFNAASQIPEGMTPEVQTIAIEANRLQAQQQQPGEPDIFPITDLTPQSDSGGGAATGPQ
jgi:hypothetical protein